MRGNLCRGVKSAAFRGMATVRSVKVMDIFSFISETLAGIESAVVALGSSPWLLLAVLLLSCIDGFFPPVPSESVVIAAAVLAVTGEVAPVYLAVLVLAAAVGAFLGDRIAYSIGSRIPVTNLPWFRGPRGQSTLRYTQQAFTQRGSTIVLTGRFIPIGRVAVNMTAGATAFPLARFLPLAGLAAVLWAGFSASTGIVAGQLLNDSPLLAMCAGIVTGMLAGLVIDRMGQRRRDRIRRRELQCKNPVCT